MTPAVWTYNGGTTYTGIGGTTDLATQSELDVHAADTTSVHGISDTSALATNAGVATAISAAVAAHEADTTNVHGVTDTSVLATDAELAAEAAARAAADTALDGRVDALEIAPPAHTHDDRYYTEAEVDALLDAVGGGGSGTVDEQELSFSALGPLVRQHAQGRHRINYEDVRETVYEDLTGWSQGVSNGITASSGRIYNNTGQAGSPKTAAIAFPGGALSASETGIAICPIQVQATGAGTGTVGFGLTNETSPNPAGDSSSTHLALFGVAPNTNLPTRFGGAGQSAGTQGAAIPAGAAAIVVVVEEKVISFSIYDSAGTRWEGYRLARDSDTATALGITQFSGSIAGLAIVHTDSRGASGHTLGPIGWRRSIVSMKTRTATTSGNAISGVAPHAYWGLVTTVTPSDRFSFVFPSGWDSRKPLPVVLWLHGSSRDERNFYEGAGGTLGGAQATFTKALLDAGFGLALPYMGGNTWGNTYALDSAVAAYRWARDHLAIGGVVTLGWSMGGIAALNLLARRTVPGISGFAGIYPATNLSHIFTTQAGLADDIKTAYGIASNGSDYATKTSGFDPMLNDPEDYRGVRMRFYASPDDTAVTKAENSDAFAALVTGHVPEATVVAATGAHGDTSHLQAADLVSFFKRCLGTDNVTDAGTLFLEDTFTAADSTTLVSHTGELAHWNSHASGSGVATILSNRVRRGASNSLLYASEIPITAEYDIEFDVYANSDDNVSSAGVMGRLSTGALTGINARYTNNGDKWQIILWTAGSNTTLGEYVGDAPTVGGSPRRAKLKIRNGSQKLEVDGVERISTSDTTITAAGRIGVYMVSGNNLHLDRVRAVVG